MTSRHRYDYCALYLRGVSQDRAVQLAARVTGAERDGQLLDLLHIDGIEVEVLRNPGHAPRHDRFGFPTWPVKIEVERGDGAAHQVIEVVSKILTAAWHAGYDAVAACDYEDELPDQGGYPRYRN